MEQELLEPIWDRPWNKENNALMQGHTSREYHALGRKVPTFYLLLLGNAKVNKQSIGINDDADVKTLDMRLLSVY